MKQIAKNFKFLFLALVISSCGSDSVENDTTADSNAIERKTPNSRQVDRFADIQVLRYEITDFNKLTLNQKKLVYFLAEAGLAGRDIIYDQNNPYNLKIRKALEKIVEKYKGDKESDNWYAFMTYTKQVWFSNGIHHHYGMDKIIPKFKKSYFKELTAETNTKLDGATIDVMFDSDKEMKRKVKDSNVDMIASSANGFYGEGVTQKMVEAYYLKLIDTVTITPIEYGLNSTMILKNGKVFEDVWKSGGKYGAAIDKVIFWLKKAIPVAENVEQKAALAKLIEYYQTGDLKTWDDYNVLWVKSTAGDIDWINGFIEVYGDALGKRATFESVVQINDFQASKQMKMVAENAQWFEDNSPLFPDHKKKNVKGVSYKVVQVASESGDASPSTPIGVNLPNNNWIRQEHGSKSVSLGNIITAYDKAGGPGMLNEFANDKEEIDRAVMYGDLAGRMHTALHEVIGHASGQINAGVGQPSETMKNYASTLEEARADLVGLYYILDPKLVELRLIPSLEVGKAEYDGYIRNGMLTQLQRLEVGKNIEEEHMQNRQLVASWVLEKGNKDKVIEKISRDGKTYYNIKDYEKLRVLFGDLLREIQRIKSEGDYKAGKDLVETYGLKVNRKTHEEVLSRAAPLDIAPYSGFVNPIFVPVLNAKGEITDIKIENKMDFVEQMLHYGKTYGILE